MTSQGHGPAPLLPLDGAGDSGERVLLAHWLPVWPAQSMLTYTGDDLNLGRWVLGHITRGWRPGAAVASYLDWGLKRHTRTPPRPAVRAQSQGVSRAALALEPPGEGPSCLFQPLAAPGSWPHAPTLPPSPRGCSFYLPCVLSSLSASSELTCHWIQGCLVSEVPPSGAYRLVYVTPH